MKALRLDRRHYAVACLIWGILLWVSASQPGSGQPQAIPGIDKVQHFFAYGIFAVLMAKATYRHHNWGSMVVILMSVILFAVCDERYQASIPGRSSSLGDVVADTIGAAVGLAAVWLWQLFNDFQKRNSSNESVIR